MITNFYNARISTTTASDEDMLKVVEFAAELGINVEVMQLSYALPDESGVATLSFQSHENFVKYVKAKGDSAA